ncbi:MAG: hypothetical protein GY732_17165 [Gammaproteobacteria bacterium]|nr:hypothetical protein [Gammaproteobacteria bacterium]
MKGPLTNKGIDFIHSAVTEIKPDENQLLLVNGNGLDYDYLECTLPGGYGRPRPSDPTRHNT